MDAAYQGNLIAALVEGKPVFVQERSGAETIVYRLEMSGENAVGFRASGTDRLITIAEIASVSLTPTQNHTCPFETLLINFVDEPTIAGDKAHIFRGGVLTTIETPLPYGTPLTGDKFVNIGMARLAPTFEATHGYQVVIYKLADEKAGPIPFPFYIFASDGKFYWQIFCESAEELRAFRDLCLPDCAVEGLPAAGGHNAVISAEGEH